MPLGLDDTFDIAYSLLERKVEIPVNSSVPTSPNWKSEDHINIFSTAHFLVHALMKDPFRSEFYLEDAPKGIWSNFFYITDVTKCPMSTITADDNGAYIKTRNTTKLYCQVGDETKGVCEESGKFYYNVKQSYNSYERKYVSSNHVILLKRSYCKAKSFPLTRTIISFSSPPDGPASPYVAVFYQTTAKISNDSKILCHGNAKKRVSLEKPYVRTNHQILSKAREFIDKGMPPKQVYDQINQESGGVFESPSQCQELRDTQ